MSITLKIVFVLLLFIFTISAFANCSGETQSNDRQNPNVDSSNSNEVSAKDDPVELGKIINLNKEPEELVYKEIKLGNQNSTDRLPAPTDKKFVAVLKFSPEETEKIIEKAKKYREPISVEIAAESWFPAELVAQSQNSGDESIKGKTYAATDFLKTPYTDGKLIKIENSDYLILELVAF